MSQFLITPADIGRKAVLKNKQVWAVDSETGDTAYPFYLRDSKGQKIATTKHGNLWNNGSESGYDIVGWYDDYSDQINPTYSDLFTHMSENHGLTLLDEEMREIVRICQAMKKDEP